jgi:hypothetical protein
MAGAAMAPHLHSQGRETMPHRQAAIVAVLVLILGVPMAAAQSVPLREVIPTMLGPGMTISPGAGGTHANDFARAFGEPDWVFSPLTGSQPVTTTDVRGRGFNGAVVEQLTTFPIASSSGGFLYAFDPAINTFTRTSESFGTSYGERPLTSGRGTFSVGFAVQSVDFNKFDDRKFESDDIRFVYAHRDLVAGLPLTPERSDVMQATLRLKISSRTSLTTLTYGVTDRLDIGATIPFSQTTLEAVVDKEILRLGTADNPTLHSFDGVNSSQRRSTGGGTASGLGDIRIAAKYNFFRRRNYALAVMQDVRLPTGDDRNLLGTGTLVSRTLAIFSAGNRSIAVNGSIGASFATTNLEAQQFVGTPSDELNQTLGIQYAVHPRVTLSAEIVGHTRVSGSDKMGVASHPVQFVRIAGGPIQTQILNELQVTEFESAANQVRPVFGVKVNPWRNLLLVGNVLLGLYEFGLGHRPAMSVGAEYTF